MRAAVIAEPKRSRVEQVARPDLGPGKALIRIEGCGVCGSNLPVWAGRPWFNYPLAPGAPGHEGWGTVEAIGDGVDGLLPGQRVAFLSSNAYAEWESIGADALVPLPASLGDSPFPGEPLGCAMNVFRRSDIHPGQTVAVVGVGFMGAVLTRLAANAGAKVIGVSRRPFALELAKRFGAAEVIRSDDPQKVIGQVKELTGGRLCERVIEAVGEQAPLDLATELTAERGRLMIAGYHQDGPRRVNMWLWNWRGLDVVNAHERDPKVYLEGIRMAVDAVASGKLDPRSLYTHTFRLDQLDDAFVAMRDRPDGFLKALVVT